MYTTFIKEGQRPNRKKKKKTQVPQKMFCLQNLKQLQIELLHNKIQK